MTGFIRICRACSAEKTNLLNLFANDGDDEPTLGEKFFACTTLEAHDSDLLPQSICYGCAKILETAFKFRKQCEHSDAEFRKKIAEKKIKTEEIKTEEEPPMVTVYLEDEMEEDDNTNHVEPIEIDSQSDDVEETQNKIVNVAISLDNRSYKCNSCVKSFFTEKALALHHNIYHKLRNSSPKPKIISNKTFDCSKCDYTFDTDAEFYTHELVEHSDQPLVCETCGKECRNKTALRHHTATHKDYRPYRCKICNKRYTDYRYLYRHKLYHQSKIFKCLESDCSKTFNVKHKLVDHLRRFHDKNLTSSQVRRIQADNEDDDNGENDNSAEENITDELAGDLRRYHDKNRTSPQVRTIQADNEDYDNGENDNSTEENITDE